MIPKSLQNAKSIGKAIRNMMEIKVYKSSLAYLQVEKYPSQYALKL